MEKRAELRKKIMTILYQMVVYDKNNIEYDVDDVIREVSEIDNEFVKEIVYGVLTYKNEIDKVANKYLEGWSIDRLGNTDISILRMGIFEILYTDIPPVIAINEAVELSKYYSDDDVRKMINACLDRIYRERKESHE